MHIYIYREREREREKQCKDILDYLKKKKTKKVVF